MSKGIRKLQIKAKVEGSRSQRSEPNIWYCVSSISTHKFITDSQKVKNLNTAFSVFMELRTQKLELRTGHQGWPLQNNLVYVWIIFTGLKGKTENKLAFPKTEIQHKLSLI